VIDQNILLTKFDKPLLPLESGLEHQMYCQKCTSAFFIPYARQYAMIQMNGLTDANYLKWQNGIGAEVFKHAEIIYAKIEEVQIELRGRKLETCYRDGSNNSMYGFEEQFLQYEALEMEYDERHDKITRHLELHGPSGTIFGNRTSTVGPEELYRKYHESYIKKTRKITGNAVEGKLEGRSPI
jgi:hypothetical protein